MTRAFGLGPVPGVSLTDAARVVVGEFPALPHVPELPARGLNSDAIGHSASLAACVDRGPRSWRLTARPRRATRLLRDQRERDLDLLEELWGPRRGVKIQVIGPWTLASRVELPGGHPALTDRGAVRDLTEGLAHAIATQRCSLARRFGFDDPAAVLVQVSEPDLAAVVSGQVPGATDFDAIPAMLREAVARALGSLGADLIAATDLPAAAESGIPTLLVADPEPEDYDVMARAADQGRRLAVRCGSEAPEETAVTLARLCSRIGIPFDPSVIDCWAGPAATLSETGRGYARARGTAELIERDAGSLA